MANKSYYELLKHPKWQAKRLRILERAGFKCELCVRDDITLHVHHTIYRKGRKPWEYDDSELLCFCEECHGHNEEHRVELRELIGFIDRKSFGLDFFQLLSYVRAMAASHKPKDGNNWLPAIPGDEVGLAHFFGLSVEDVQSAAGDEWRVEYSVLERMAAEKATAGEVADG